MAPTLNTKDRSNQYLCWNVFLFFLILYKDIYYIYTVLAGAFNFSVPIRMYHGRRRLRDE